MQNPAPAERRAVITGIGLISPLGSTLDATRAALTQGCSAVVRTGPGMFEGAPFDFVAPVPQFDGEIEQFGPLEGTKKKAIKKGLKLMCRETQMAVAAAQHALADAGFAEGYPEPERAGVVLGSDYMLTLPIDYETAIAKIVDGEGIDFTRWGGEGLREMQPLWMLKYLPNMPASHIAIFNDLRGPNNSLTMRESSGLMALGEAMRTVLRGHADMIVAGATGSRVLPMQAVHARQTEEIVDGGEDPASASRPFDQGRRGAVPGEGAAMLVVESLEHARARGARVYAELLGFGSSQASGGPRGGRIDLAVANASRAALHDAALTAGQIGHVNAHGLSGRLSDRLEAAGICAVFAETDGAPPVIATKSNHGNLGAASGLVELIGSVLAFELGALPRVLNYDRPDPECPVRPVVTEGVSPGSVALKLSTTPQGQAAAICLGAPPTTAN